MSLSGIGNPRRECRKPNLTYSDRQQSVKTQTSGFGFRLSRVSKVFDVVAYELDGESIVELSRPQTMVHSAPLS